MSMRPTVLDQRVDEPKPPLTLEEKRALMQQHDYEDKLREAGVPRSPAQLIGATFRFIHNDVLLVGSCVGSCREGEGALWIFVSTRTFLAEPLIGLEYSGEDWWAVLDGVFNPPEFSPDINVSKSTGKTWFRGELLIEPI